MKLVDYKTFGEQIKKLPKSLKGFITLYSLEEYREMEKSGAKFYLAKDKLSGFVIKVNGELISVFSLEKGRGRKLVRKAVEFGAIQLDCLGEHLKALYQEVGFKVVEQASWNEEYAPKAWDYQKFGRPNWYLMKI